MQNGKHARASDSEQRHGFGETVDRRTPILFHEKENGGDQSSGMADADPPNEIDDGKSRRLW
jgi:fructoselysine-6-P-deglycase FrlB-like protein